MLDDEASAVLAERAANQLADNLAGSKAKGLHDALMQLKVKVGSLSFNFRHDLFAWTECFTGCFMKDDDGKPALCALVVMVILYGFGITLFFMHLQYNQYCEDNLTTIGANAANVSCAGWADECRIWGTTFSLKAYMQYRAAAYVLLLLPFLYMPYMVLVSINQMVTNIVGTLVDLAETDDEKKYTTYVKQQNQKRLEQAEEFQSREKDMRYYGDTVKLVGTILSQMDKDGHNQVVLLLFFLFHGVMGAVSLYFDGSVYMTLKNHDDDKKCERYQKRLEEMAPDTLPISIEFLTMWHLSLGSVWMLVTLSYLLVQFRMILGARVVNRGKAAQQSEDARVENEIQRFLARSAATKEIQNFYSELNRARGERDALKQENARMAATQQNQGTNDGRGWDRGNDRGDW
jgi:ABC-type multidrug transport system fused ATPase/permease subunit